MPRNTTTRAQAIAVFLGDWVNVLGYAGRWLPGYAQWLSRWLRAGSGSWFNGAYVEGAGTPSGTAPLAYSP
jgi:hypothetical protein